MQHPFTMAIYICDGYHCRVNQYITKKAHFTISSHSNPVTVYKNEI